MTRFLKKACISACGMLLIPLFAVAPIHAESTPAPSQTPAVESPAVATPTATPAVVSFKSTFPDDNLRKAVNEMFFNGDMKDDTMLTADYQKTIAAKTGKLDLSGKGIVNLKGIELFSGVTELDCSHNNLQLLDLSLMSGLVSLDASYNDLTQFTVAKDNKLVTINCSNNNLSALNLAGFTTIESLDCSNNKITILNVAGLYKLTTLNCSNNELTALGIDGLVALENLYSDGNSILSLDVSSLKNLKVLENRKSTISLKLQTIGTDCGVILPTGAAAPSNISASGTYKAATNSITWDKATGVPASFTYTYTITGTTKTVTVTVYLDKTEYVEKAVAVGKVATLTVTSTGYNKVKLSWSGVDGASGYRVYRSTSKSSGFSKIKSLTNTSKLYYTNTGISCGTTYYYKVRAYRVIDGVYYYGSYSSVISGKPVPAAPGALSIAKASSKKVTISYNKVSGASGYRIYRSRSKASGYSKIKTYTSGSKLSYTKATSRYVKFYYKVRAYKLVNGKKVWGKYSSVKAKTLK